jgi:hypothetical protein
LHPVIMGLGIETLLLLLLLALAPSVALQV